MITWNDSSFSYSGQEAGSLEKINLTIRKGECVLFCGRSGCGKTTMLRQVNGLIPNFFAGEGGGTVMLEGREISEIPMYRLAEKVGSVFQNPRTQFFNVDTDSEIAFGIENQAVLQEELERRVEQTAKDLHIEHLRDRSIFALSGGEKQKIAFASVYAMDPEIYVLDEPSSNLDAESIEELRNYLKFIKKQGKTILIAEHRLHYLMDVADRIVYMEQGRIVGIYSPEELSGIPRSRQVEMGLRAADLRQVRVQRTEAVLGRNMLELENVTLRYKNRLVLEHVSFQASGGEIIAVTGHNGAGKTTLARALCGLHGDCEGEFWWDGKRVERKARLKQSYLVMQDVGYELFAESVEKECVFGIRNPDRELAERTLQELELSEYRNRHPNTLSGGQKQRLAVAVSMVCRKEILVFDEPTSGLDYDSMMCVSALMGHLAEQGKIIFIVTHDFELICKVCSRILHFDHGKMRADLAVVTENEEMIRALFEVGGAPAKKEG